MFKIKFFLTVAILLGIVNFASAQSNVGSLTPMSDSVDWSVGSPHQTTWTYNNAPYYNACDWQMALIPDTNSALPTYSGAATQHVGGSGVATLTPQANSVPGDYRTRVFCPNSDNPSVSAGIVRLLKSSFKHLTLG